MTDAYEVISILLDELCVIGTENAFSMMPEQAVEHNTQFLRKYVAVMTGIYILLAET